MELIDIQKGLESVANAAGEAYEKCAVAKGKFTNLDGQEKSKLAILCMKFGDGKMAENKVMRLALASEEYQSFLNEVAWARTEYLIAQAEVDALEMRADMLRSLNKNYLGEFESTKFGQ